MIKSNSVMKTVIVTGGSGFVGYYFILELLSQGYYIYAIMRPGSKHKNRLIGLSNIKIIEMDLNEILDLPLIANIKGDIFYHLGWECEQRDFYSQTLNIQYTVNVVEIAKKTGCKRFIGVGSQAEYGICHGEITELTNTMPFTAYGASKLSSCHLSRIRARELKIDWIWARLFSVYGPHDGTNTLISYLIKCFINGEIPQVTNAEHLWDYLYVTDAAKALCQLGKTEQVNEIYNVANGKAQPLKAFIEQTRGVFSFDQSIVYGKKARIITPLDVSIEKIKKYTGWSPVVSFKEGLRKIKSSNLI